MAMLCIGGVVGWVLHTPPPFKTLDGFRTSPPELSNVFVSWDIPEQAIAGNGYQINLNLQELQGQNRVVTTLSFEGFMLTRALDLAGTDPQYYESKSNIGDGWIDKQLRVSLDAFTMTTISIFGNSGRAGPAFGEIVVCFENEQSVRIPIYYEIAEQ